MDQITELEKYKSLLDSGAISEDEFKNLKQKLLGLKSEEEKELEKQQERNAALAEIERIKQEKERQQAEQQKAELAKKAKAEKDQIEKKKAELQDNYNNVYSTEKAREQARLEAISEHEHQQKEAQAAKVQQGAKAATNVAVNVLMWILTVMCILGSIGSFGTMKTNPALYIMSGVIFAILALMACPSITKMTREDIRFDYYTRFKKLIVIGLFVLWVILTVILQ